ncbi:MAG: OB-fold nucleic acid binding domain-containing protein [Comamonadaceae bacterium]|nr:OB-fold nucleic acid binding domain-containing protein [Comamonadaceae bacterium]
MFERYGYRGAPGPGLRGHRALREGHRARPPTSSPKEMYTFTDKGGRSLTLRPEYTPSVVRAIVEHRLDLAARAHALLLHGPDVPLRQAPEGALPPVPPGRRRGLRREGPGPRRRDRRDGRRAAPQARRARDARPWSTRSAAGPAGRPTARPCARRPGSAGRALRRLPAEGRDEPAADLRLQGRGLPGPSAAAFPLIRRLPLRRVPGALRRGCAAYLDLYGLAYRVEPRLVRGLDYYTQDHLRDRHRPHRRPERHPRRRPLRRHDEGLRRARPLRHRLRHGHGAAVLAVADAGAAGPADPLPRLPRRGGRDGAAMELARCLRGERRRVPGRVQGPRHEGPASAGPTSSSAAWVLIVGEDEIEEGPRSASRTWPAAARSTATREELLAVPPGQLTGRRIPMNHAGRRPARLQAHRTTAATCGPPHDGREVVLCGWVHKARDMGHLVFVDLRDREGLAQVVFQSDRPDLAEEAKKLRDEFVVGVRGRVRRRSSRQQGHRRPARSRSRRRAPCLRRRQGAAVRRRRPAPGLRGAAAEVPLPRPAPARRCSATSGLRHRGRAGRPQLPEPAAASSRSRRPSWPIRRPRARATTSSPAASTRAGSTPCPSRPSSSSRP